MPIFHFRLVLAVFTQTTAVQIRPHPDGEHQKNLQAHPVLEQELRPDRVTPEACVPARQGTPTAVWETHLKLLGAFCGGGAAARPSCQRGGL